MPWWPWLARCLSRQPRQLGAGMWEHCSLDLLAVCMQGCYTHGLSFPRQQVGRQQLTWQPVPPCFGTICVLLPCFKMSPLRLMVIPLQTWNCVLPVRIVCGSLLLHPLTVASNYDSAHWHHVHARYLLASAAPGRTSALTQCAYCPCLELEDVHGM